MRIPTHDAHQNLLRDLTPACWQWLEQSIPTLVHSIHAEGPHAGHRGTHRHLHVLAMDTPETDSHIKQMATFIGELTNHDHTLVSKEGQRGAEAWKIANRFCDGGPGKPEAIGFQAVNHEDPAKLNV